MLIGEKWYPTGEEGLDEFELDERAKRDTEPEVVGASTCPAGIEVPETVAELNEELEVPREILAAVEP